MPVLSSLRASTGAGARAVLRSGQGCPNFQLQVRTGAGVGMKKPTKYLWNKMKDDFHFFVGIGLIPLVSMVAYANLFIGPAELRDIPEGYVPYDYEYIRHPVSRFLQKHIFPSYEKQYEKTLYYLYFNSQVKHARYLQQKVKSLSRQNQDEENWYFVPVSTPVYEKEDQIRRIRQDKFNQ